MPCNRPLAAWHTRIPNASGKYGVTFTFAEADTSRPIAVPCRRCLGCRIERSAEWASRLMHEAQSWDHNYFLTLTYNDQALPRLTSVGTSAGRPTLRPLDMVQFLDRLRAKLRSIHGDDNDKPRFRYYQCGEYGETTERPHHHAIMFNLNLPDLVLLRAQPHALYESRIVENAWRHGHISLGSVTFESAQYVAGYVTKKVTGPMAASHYDGRTPEYATMSRRPGIGAKFLEQHHASLYALGRVPLANTDATRAMPVYYDRKLEQLDSDAYATAKSERALKARHLKPRQLQAREAKAETKSKTYRPRTL